jgi:hypothetical protein
LQRPAVSAAGTRCIRQPISCDYALGLGTASAKSWSICARSASRSNRPLSRAESALSAPGSRAGVVISKEAQPDEHANDYMSMRPDRIAVVTLARSRRSSRMRAKSGRIVRPRRRRRCIKYSPSLSAGRVSLRSQQRFELVITARRADRSDRPASCRWRCSARLFGVP